MASTITDLVNAIIDDRTAIYEKVADEFLVSVADNTLESVKNAIVGIQVHDKGNIVSNEGVTTEYPAGYYKAFSITGGSAADNYTTQSKTVQITTDVLTNGLYIDQDEGYFALDNVTIEANTDFLNYAKTTANAANVLAGTKFVSSENVVTDGTMVNNGAVTATLDTDTTSYTIPQGYHNGSGKVTISTETKSVTPTKSSQTVTPTDGKVLSSVTVSAIPAAYQDVTGVTAVASDVLVGSTFVDSSGKEVDGTMANLGSVGATLTTASPSTTISTGYTTGGTISVKTTTATVTPSTSVQTVTGDSNAFLTSVTVNAIPNQQTAVPASIDGINTTEVTVPAGYYTTASKVTFDETEIVALLQQI